MLSFANDDYQESDHLLPELQRDRPLDFRFRPAEAGGLLELLDIHPNSAQQANVLEAILAQLIVAHRVDPHRNLSYSRRPVWYSERRYLPPDCTYRSVVR